MQNINASRDKAIYPLDNIGVSQKKKSTDKIDGVDIEEQNEVWIVRRICPIDLEGHVRIKKFVVLVDWKTKYQRL